MTSLTVLWRHSLCTMTSLTLYYDVTHSGLLTSPTLYYDATHSVLWRHFLCSMTSLTLVYDVTHSVLWRHSLCTMTSLSLVYDVTHLTLLLLWRTLYYNNAIPFFYFLIFLVWKFSVGNFMVFSSPRLATVSGGRNIVIIGADDGNIYVLSFFKKCTFFFLKMYFFLKKCTYSFF